MREQIPIISLFSGPGGMDLGFRRAGFIPIFAADFDPASVETYNRNARRAVAHQIDLNAVKDDELLRKIEHYSEGVRPRGVIGGPPCQAFSLANVTPRRNDPRKKLLTRYADLLAALNSRYDLDFFVFENVGGIKLTRNVRFFRKTVNRFRAAGFHVFEAELNAAHFGVAQIRRRVFVVGINSARFPLLPFQFPDGEGGRPKTVQEVIGNLAPPAFFARNLPKKDIPEHVNHWAMRPKSDKFRHSPLRSGRSFRRLDWNEPSWTVAYGNREMHVHPSGARRISIFEAMLLQGFPKSYQLFGTFSDQVRQISNAVPPPLSHAIARRLRYSLYEIPVEIQKRLTKWHLTHARSFPWRKARDPYKLLVAEKLLQQTSASDQLVKAYTSLVNKFPTVRDLSKARMSDVRSEFRRIGLPYRAAELVELANQICQKHRGKIPNKLVDLLMLPGIGDYSARALLCFGRGERLPIVDTNIARFLIRFHGLKIKMPTNAPRNPALRKLASHLVPKRNPANFNYGLLDLCAQVCTAKSPQCFGCPLRWDCAFFKSAQHVQHQGQNAA